MSCQNPHDQKVAAVFGFAIRLASHPFLHPRLLRMVWVWWRSAILILTPPVPSKGKCCFEKIESEKSLCFRHLDFSLWLMTYKLSFLLLFCRFVHYAADRCSTFVGQFRTICCSITSHRHNAQELNIFHTGLCIPLWECCKCFCVCRPMNIT